MASLVCEYNVTLYCILKMYNNGDKLELYKMSQLFLFCFPFLFLFLFLSFPPLFLLSLLEQFNLKNLDRVEQSKYVHRKWEGTTVEGVKANWMST